MEQEFDDEVSVVVAGSGCAGCAAAISAAHHGASTVVVAEKSVKMVGGTTKLAGGGWLWCPGNPFLLDLGVKYDPEEVVELLADLALGNGYQDSELDRSDLALIKTFAYDWPNVVKQIIDHEYMDLKLVDAREEEDAIKLEELILKKADAFEGGREAFFETTGVTLANLKKLAHLMPSYCAEHPRDNCPTGKVLAPDGGTTSKQLEKSAKKFKNVEFRMGTAVTDLIWLDGECVGCVLENVSTGKTTRVRATNGVIFASGGFAHNKELMRSNYGRLGEPFGTCSARTNTGDLVNILKRAPGMKGPIVPCEGMDQAWVKQTVLPYVFPQRLGVFFLNGDSFFVVDRTGKRYACEKDFYQERATQMRGHPDRRVVFFVYDKRAGELFDGPIKGLGGPIPWTATEDKDFVSGSSTGELTSEIKNLLAKVVPGYELDDDFAANLTAQLKRFNEMAKSGVDYEFKRGENAAQYAWAVPRAADNDLPNKTMYPLDASNLRCVMLGLSTLDTKGGPRIDTSGRLLDITRTPVKGVYGAGNAVKSATNHSYPASGATMSNGVLFGWKAGQAAVFDSKLAAL